MKSLKFDFPLIKKMFLLGLPASFGNSLHAVGMTFMTFLVASFGTIATAAYGIGGRMLSFIIIPAFGISMAASTLVGQNIGAQKVDRAEKIVNISSLISFVSLTIVGVLMFIFAKDLSSFFLPGEPETIEMAVSILRFMALVFGFIGIQIVIEGAFRGAGCTGVSMALVLITLWGMQFPIAYILSKYTGLAETGIWISIPISSILGCILSLIWFYKGGWKKKKLTEEIKVSEKILEEAALEEGMN